MSVRYYVGGIICRVPVWIGVRIGIGVGVRIGVRVGMWVGVRSWV